ncbi:PEP-CTERM sorting domain-containing protein [Nostoc sp. WHI]|uniref:PEP-CTERM sorting domain-containing protein n=1 Tax=Nostoc sp. WHI TaxID=2650611 RepID=UPI0018C6C5D2|nr:PEP-CTERM sorting domain-containing protein [Nostoc sp. WHI]MBG1267483.1 PEP-CTERM sorting domain-containing protein [Nostoc sp. WHI]MBG1267554.1 PEP-CTERM sorting domain-containing protein [Nostoc sp. WHI]
MKNCYKLAITAAIVGFGLGTLNVAQAATVSLTSSNQGWWSTDRSNQNQNENYITGNLGIEGFRSFFTFDLGTLARVSTATLQVQRYEGSVNPTTTLGFFDVETSADVLSQKVNNPDINIYNDLGSGKNYGTFNVTNTFGNSDEILNFVLNSDAIADINARSGKFFSIGGALLGVLETEDQVQVLFGASGDSSAILVVDADLVPVPEPATLSGITLAGITGWWLKRKRKAFQAL